VRITVGISLDKTQNLAQGSIGFLFILPPMSLQPPTLSLPPTFQLWGLSKALSLFYQPGSLSGPEGQSQKIRARIKYCLNLGY
jgi:hypothetical protein